MFNLHVVPKNIYKLIKKVKIIFSQHLHHNILNKDWRTCLSNNYHHHVLMILLPLHPASLMHKSPQTCKIIHGMRPVGCNEQSTDLKILW